MCCSLFEIFPHKPMCLDTWFPTGGIVWEALGSLGDEAFQKEVGHQWLVLRCYGLVLFPVCSFFSPQAGTMWPSFSSSCRPAFPAPMDCTLS